MKKICFVLLALFASNLVLAEEKEEVLQSQMTSTEYQSSISFETRKSTYKTGWQLVKIGDHCFKEESSLVKVEKQIYIQPDFYTEHPTLKRSREKVDCPK